jgi:cell shape-determining protein MreC
MPSLLKPTRTKVLTGLMMLAVILTLLGENVSATLRGPTRVALDPLGDAGMYVATSVKRVAADVGEESLTGADARELREENERLWDAVHLLYGRLVEQRDRQEEQDNLLLSLYASRNRLFGEIPEDEFQWEIVPARFVGTDSLPYGRSRAVNAGRVRGVVDGSKLLTRRVALTSRSKALVGTELAVISTEALVGEVTRSWAFGARVRLVTDRDFDVNALIRREIDPENPRTVTIVARGSASEQTLTPDNDFAVPVRAVGDGDRLLVMRDVPEQHNILPGDKLYLREDDYYLPARVRIGTIVRVEKQPKDPSFVTLYAEPAVDLQAIRDVYVVVPAKPWPAAIGEGG